MALVRVLPVLAATLCANALGAPLGDAAAWMTDAQPFRATVVEQHFGLKVKQQCAGTAGVIECVATGGKIDMRWRANADDGAVHDGYLRLPLDGCIGRRRVEALFGAPLDFDANSSADRSPMVTLSARYWTPERMWRVSVAFDRDCARQLTIAAPAF